MANKPRLQAFISSTFIDLKEERRAATEAVLTAGHIPAGMEMFVADDVSQWDIIKTWIAESDVYILLSGGRYGSIPKGRVKSYTEREYEFAKKLKKRILRLVATDTFIEKSIKSKKLKHDPDDLAKAKAFRDRVKNSDKLAAFFENGDQIKTAVSLFFKRIETEPSLGGWVRATIDPGPTLLFPKTWNVGHGILPNVEASHNCTTLSKMVYDRPDQKLKIGSPYLRYWLGEDDEPRLGWLLENTSEIRIEIVLFEATDNTSERHRAAREEMIKRAKRIKKRFPDRLKFKAVRRPTDLSYILYPLASFEGGHCRAMIGLQVTSYRERPFVELVHKTDDAPPMVEAARALHNECI